MPDKKGKLSWNEMAKNLYYETTKKKKKKEYPQILFKNIKKNPLLPGILAGYKVKQIKDKKIEKEKQDARTKAFLEKIRKFKKGGKLKGGNRDMFSEQYD